MDVLKYALLGLGPGAVYAMAAQALVISYRVSGVINFAQCAVGSIGAYVFYEANSKLGIPGGVALVIGVVSGAMAGALLQLLVLRPLRGSSNLAKMVAMLGVLMLILSVESTIYGPDLKIVPSIFPSGIVSWLADVSADRLSLLAVSVVTTVALGLLYTRTNFGRVTNAVAENPISAAAAGVSPQRVALLNWGLSGAIGAFGSILIAPLVGLHPVSLGLIVLAALAAAVIGGFSSFPLTLAGGVFIGILQGLAGLWFPNTAGLPTSLPFVVILVVLTIRGRALPTRADVVERLPGIGTGRVHVVPLLVAVAASIWLIYNVETSWVDAITTSLLFGLVGLSSVVVVGYAGQLSLAQFMLAGLSGWAGARLVATQGISYELAFLVGVVMAMLAGLVASLPTLRTRGPALAIATLGLAVILQSMLLGTGWANGNGVGSPVGNLRLFGMEFSSIFNPARYCVLVLVVMVVCGLIVTNLRRGNAGRRMIAVRSNERAAAALGVSTRWAKAYAFMISAGIAGVAGFLMAFRAPVADFTSYDVLTSISVLAFQVIGGVGYVSGMIFGMGFAPGGIGQRPFQDFQHVHEALTMLGGALLVITVIFEPDGIAAGAGARRAARLLAPLLRPLTPVVRAVRPPASKGRPAPRIETDASAAVSVAPRTLIAKNIEVRFGNVHALRGVSLDVRPGEVTALIGPNGAGKSTFIDTITGFVKPVGGEVLLDGKEISRWSVARRSRAGIGRSFQSLELFEDLSVQENLAVAADPASRRAWLINPFWARSRPLDSEVLAATRDLDVIDLLDRKPGDLSYGQRRVVAIARALAARPSVLLLDEPAAGLDEAESAELGTTIKRLAEEWGVGILLVEHDMDMVMKISDRVVVINFGGQIIDGTPAEVQASPEVVAAYLGVEEDDVTAEDLRVEVELIGESTMSSAAAIVPTEPVEAKDEAGARR